MKCLILVGTMASCAVGGLACAADLDTSLAQFQAALRWAYADTPVALPALDAAAALR
jgi:hypothetical protein